MGWRRAHSPDRRRRLRRHVHTACDEAEPDVLIAPLAGIDSEPRREERMDRFHTGSHCPCPDAASQSAHDDGHRRQPSPTTHCLRSSRPRSPPFRSTASLPTRQIWHSLIDSIADQLPEATATLIEDSSSRSIDGSETGLGIATAIGIVAALYSASAGAKV